MRAYCLFDNVEVVDGAGLAAYVEGVRETVHAHGGRYRAVGGTVVTVEGDASLTYPVLIEFPDLVAAQRWYDSPEYQPLKALRLASARGNANFFETAPSALLEEEAEAA